MRPTPIHLPLALLALAAGSAVLWRGGAGDAAAGNGAGTPAGRTSLLASTRLSLQKLFLPVSYPAGLVGNTLKARLYPPVIVDVVSPDHPRTPSQLIAENAELHERINYLEAQLEDLRGLSAIYAQYGSDIMKRSQAARVVGGSMDRTQTLTIATDSLSSIQENMLVIHTGGVAGRIQTVGSGIARVLLVTDAQSRMQCRFQRIVVNPDGKTERYPIEISKPLVEGTGKGMIIRFLTAAEVRTRLQVGDRVLLDDPSWPVRGLQIGRVREIKLPPTDAGHAEVIVEPTLELSTLREVRVVNR